MRGSTCFKSSSHFPPIEYSKLAIPVVLPPGRAKLVDHARLDRIKSRDKDDGHRVCGVARRQHGRRARGQDHIGLAANQIGREAGELVGPGTDDLAEVTDGR